ncbi:hypothetical protein QUA74_11215 [Microcoleus sp. LAD1_D3]|uniref:hypothetical protein n=1 Tax=Microcoleus sp. LAD1_D3 TaxID=2819365 RepID=UPI002FD41E4B
MPRIKVTHQEHRVPIAFFPKAEALTPGFVTILDRVEQVHLRKPAFRRTFDYVA